MRWNGRFILFIYCLSSVTLFVIFSFLLLSSQYQSCYYTQPGQTSHCDCERAISEDGGKSGQLFKNTANNSDDAAILDDSEVSSFTFTQISLENEQHTSAHSERLEIPCLINGKSRFACLRDAQDEVFLPFKAFLSKHLEITGNIVRDPAGEERFEWWHSYAKISRPSQTYNPRGVFGQFATYNVENRDRVKCISGIDGVPLSVQWGPEPYHYAIQISQYALEHYSRHLTEYPPQVETIASVGLVEVSETNVLKMKNLWKLPVEFSDRSSVSYHKDASSKTNVLVIKTDESMENQGAFVYLSQDRKMRVLEFSAKFLLSLSSFTVVVERTDTNEFFNIHYVQTNEILKTVSNGPKRGGTIYYGIGAAQTNRPKRSPTLSDIDSNADQEHKTESQTGRDSLRTPATDWRRITRDIFTDFSKALSAMSGKRKFNVMPDYTRLVSLAFRGHVAITNLSLLSSAHLSHFFDGANWLLNNQDKDQGGWSIPVARNMDKFLSLPPGWHSAMAQGHAMSVLCRAYVLSGEQRYLDSALRATKLFDISASDGGVLNKFLGHLNWYEEYPTTPGTFVLNGFIYSLIGLYDLKMVSGGDTTATRLFQTGMSSLKQLLPLYDTGSGSVYDLRHISLQLVSPKLARWDYHAVHIYQLFWLGTIDPDPIFNKTAGRWMKYAIGERAKHN